MISIVLYGRNDSYGYNLHKRAAISLNCMAEVLTDPEDEIIFVDYNTPDDFPTFPEAIQDTLTDKAKALLRILRVRPKHHERLRDKTHLVCLEPIARNVGVRRSNPNNRWILSTNTDMVFVPRKNRSLSEIAATLPDAYYHLPRFEVPETLWESADRMDAHGTIEAFRAWGEAYHLNEIVTTSHPEVKYDGPGDFQLILRDDLRSMNGFHEGMLLGWHVDTNTAKRLYLLPRLLGDVVDELYGYHCDHTRQVTPAHRARAAQNDQKIFYELVTRAVVPEQADTWGLAGESIEDLKVNTTSRNYLAAIETAVPRPLAKPTTTGYSATSFNHIDYTVEHVLPFLADSLASYPRNTILGWIGAKKSLLESFARVWTTMGFSEPILVFAEALWANRDLPSCCLPATREEVIERATVFVFDWGRPDDSGPLDEWTFDRDTAIQRVTRIFRRAVRDERSRRETGVLSLRRFIGINTICNAVEGIFNSHIGVALTPLATHIRQGFLSEASLDEANRNLVQALYVGQAGQRLDEGIVALPGIDGHVFYGPFLDLDAGTYRVTLEFARINFNDEEQVLVLEIVSNGRLLSYREISRRDLVDGTVSHDFYISREISAADNWPRIEFRLKTPGNVDLVVGKVRLEDLETISEAQKLRAFDSLPLVTVGPAGKRQGRVVVARDGIADVVVHGPYFWLEGGRYEVTFEFDVRHLAKKASIRTYVVTHLGNRVLAESRIEPTARGRLTCALSFELEDECPPEQVGLLEFLVWSAGKLGFSLRSLRVKYVSPQTGSRQLPPSENQIDGKDVLPLLATSYAGKRIPGAILILADFTGVAFFGPFIDLAAGRYRLTLGFEAVDKKRLLIEDPGLAVNVVSNSRPLAHHALTQSEMIAGYAEIAFEIPTDDYGRKIEFVMRTTGDLEAALRTATLEELPGTPSSDARVDFDLLKMLDIGPAGSWRASALTKERLAIRGVMGVCEFCAYGPYISLEPGTYEVSYELLVGRGLPGSSIRVDVATDIGRQILAEDHVKPGLTQLVPRTLGFGWLSMKTSLQFTVVENPAFEALYEFRVWTSGKLDFYLTSVRVHKISVERAAGAATVAASP